MVRKGFMIVNLLYVRLISLCICMQVPLASKGFRIDFFGSGLQAPAEQGLCRTQRSSSCAAMTSRSLRV